MNLVRSRTAHGGILVATMLCATAAVTPASANLSIMAIYSAGITTAAQSIIADAIAFYATNFTGNGSVTIGFGLNGEAGGASSNYFTQSVSYGSYLNQLQSNRTESATDVAALASLPANSPFLTATVSLTTTLFASLGLGPASAPEASNVKGCIGSVINACVGFGSSYITGGANGGPAAGLFAVTEHEIDEVLGTGSDLSATVAAASSAADLFRFAAPGVRSLTSQPGTTVPCPAGAPGAYLSVNGGTTSLAIYNNCNNGGDYGDFAATAVIQPQDAYGSGTDPSALTLASPEVALLDAIGYNILSSPLVAVGTANPRTTTVLGTSQVVDGGIADGEFLSVPEPASMSVFGLGLAAIGLIRRRIG